MLKRFILNLPLGYKLNGIMVSIAALTLMLVSVAYFVHQHQVVRQQATIELATLSQIYSDTSTAALAFDDKDGANDLLASLAAKPTIRAASVLNRHGDIFARYLASGVPQSLLSSFLPNADPVESAAQIKRDLFHLKTPITLDHETIGTFLIVADFSDVRATQRRFILFLGVLFSLALMISTFLSSRLQRHITLPIHNLTTTMGTVSESNDFSLRVQSSTTDEVGQLCLGFNAMLERIEQQATLLQSQKENLHFLATHDALTGLPNRTLLYDRLHKGLTRARRNNTELAVMFIDLDRFKNINDTMGHDIGDLLLKAVASRLKEAVREDDTVARFGGDEFVILLDSVKMEAIEYVITKVTRAVKMPIELQQRQVVITPSIGLASFPQHGAIPDELIKYADVAMYHAKNSGRDTAQRYFPEMTSKIHARFNLENKLHTALARNEFTIHYQPQFELRTRKICSCEALLRWQVDGKDISPVEFIPIAEDNGLIVPIGRWVLQQACHQAMLWQRPNQPPIKIAVNVSARQFFASDLIIDVEKALKDSGLPPSCLELEITETMIMTDIEKAISVMDRISAMGVEIAMDDFGTGYSSLSYLKRFPLSKLKIDRSFVRDVLHDEDDAAITRAVVSMALALNIDVLAEGIETEGQLEFFHALNCRYGQGYLLARPIPAEQLTALLNQISN
ncbi:MAG: EAL domain-containing protein [Desulfuromonadales bacterium]|nr:EAL domain-containing protein [Desulfuromonadales bacterium]